MNEETKDEVHGLGENDEIRRKAASRLAKIRPKLHYLWHVAAELQPQPGPAINPNVFSCWNDESYMGRVGKLAAKTHKRTVPLRVIHRYMYVLAKQMTKVRETVFVMSFEHLGVVELVFVCLGRTTRKT